MDIRPLTKEQRRFAEENHHLVFTFLNQKDLPESAFSMVGDIDEAIGKAKEMQKNG